MQHIKVDQAYIDQLDAQAFQLLPRELTYDPQGRQMSQIPYDGDPGWTYERFRDQLDVLCGNEDERAIVRLGRRLEGIGKGIDLVREVGSFAEPDWIVEGIVVRNGLTLLYGESGSGKTTLCLYLAHAVQTGTDLFGLKCKQGNVVFVENDESWELLKSHRDKVGLPNRLNVANTHVAWDANSKKFNKEFDDLLYYHCPDVLIIDAYTSLEIPDITRPESALVLDELRRLAKKHSCAMVIIHHVNKTGDQMGSSLHKAKMDSMVSLVNVNDIVTLTQEKVRGSKFEPKGINLDPITLKMTESKMTLKEQVKRLKAQNYSRDQIQSMFPGAKKDTIRKYYNSP